MQVYSHAAQGSPHNQLTKHDSTQGMTAHKTSPCSPHPNSTSLAQLDPCTLPAQPNMLHRFSKWASGKKKPLVAAAAVCNPRPARLIHPPLKDLWVDG